MNSGFRGVSDTQIAAQFWLFAAGISRIADCPLVLPSPIMPNKTEPAGLIWVLELSSPLLLMNSLVFLTRENWTSPELAHGMFPFQYDGFFRLGVAPTSTLKPLPNL